MRSALLGSVLAALLLAPGTLSAQTATGQITGTVKDPSGSVMSKVKVVVTNEQTGLTRERGQRERGLRGAAAARGSYVVTAEQSGFKVAVRRG